MWNKKTKRNLAILLIAMALGLSAVVQAEPMGTAFTYQGRLIDANEAADGFYDFQFKLFDDANVVDGNQVGGDVNVPDVDVIDGYFTVELDFGSSVFEGDARWLEIGVRPGYQNDPNVYLPLEPLQEMTPTPYALHAGSDGDWMVKGNGNVMYSIPDGNVAIGATNPVNSKLYVLSPLGDYGPGRSTIYGRRSGSDVAANGGTGWSLNAVDAAIKGYSLPGNNYTAGVAGYNFMDHPQSAGVIGARKNANIAGILGYNDAASKLWAGYFVGDGYFSSNLEVAGQVKITGGSPGDGKVLTSDPAGLGSWQTPAAGGDSDWTISGNDMYTGVGVTGNVGIGTDSPLNKLHIYGTDASLLQVENPSDYARVVLNGTTGKGGDVIYQIDGTSEFGLVYKNGRFAFLENDSMGAEVMTIKDGGDVGIGTNTPSAKLEVAGGAIKATGGLIIETRTSDPCSPVTGQIWLRTDIP